MRYIGNKRKLVDKIISLIGDDTNVVVADLFAGSGTITKALANKYKNVISNDIMHYSYTINRAINQPKKLDDKKISKILKKMNEEFVEGWVFRNFSEHSGRKYFSDLNAKKIDGSRILINDLLKKKKINNDEESYLIYCLLEAASKVSNTTGTYGAFLKKWDQRALKEMKIEKMEYQVVNGIKIFNYDIIELINQISGDILYLDPPYTSVDYSSAYHVLEDISQYDSPTVQGITGQRTLNNKRNDLAKKTKAYSSMFKIIKSADFKKIIISYSNHGILSVNDFKSIAIKLNFNFSINKIKYREYKNINKSQKGELFEFLITLQKNNCRNPINYSGNKNGIMSDLIKIFPSEIDNFVDVFAGGLNVSINTPWAKNIFANDINNFVIEMYKKLKNVSVDKILERINELGLIKNDKESYIKLREEYNKEHSSIDLFLLQIYGFNGQFRMNSEFGYNNPVGYGEFSKKKQNEYLTFKKKLKNIKLYSYNFEEFIDNMFKKNLDNALFYLDPPYLITTASYNDGKRSFGGWTTKEEVILLEKINEISQKHKFVLSNVIEHKGNENTILINWIIDNGFLLYEINSNKRKEIVVTNYEVKGYKKINPKIRKK